jgi:predicted dehydrogenase
MAECERCRFVSWTFERLLIVGLGSIGMRHARIARSIAPDVHITAWRRDASAALPDGIDRMVATLDEALDSRPQLAVIASPATRHLEAALPLAAAGVHLLMEKPIAASAEGVSELVEVCRRSQVTLMTGYNLRFLPALQHFRDLVQAARVGRVLSVRAEVGQSLPTWRPSMDYRATVSARADLGGGVLLELSHEIDYLRWVFGEVEWVSATLLRQSALEIDVEDTAHLVLGFADVREAPPVVAVVNMDFVRHDSTRVCTVIGETGTLRWNGPTGTVDIFEPGATAWRELLSLPSGRDDSYIAEWRHLLSCLETGSQPLITGEDGLAVLHIVDAARRSSLAGTRMWLDPRRAAEASPVERM